MFFGYCAQFLGNWAQACMHCVYKNIAGDPVLCHHDDDVVCPASGCATVGNDSDTVCHNVVEVILKK